MCVVVGRIQLPWAEVCKASAFGPPASWRQPSPVPWSHVHLVHQSQQGRGAAVSRRSHRSGAPPLCPVQLVRSRSRVTHTQAQGRAGGCEHRELGIIGDRLRVSGVFSMVGIPHGRPLGGSPARGGLERRPALTRAAHWAHPGACPFQSSVVPPSVPAWLWLGPWELGVSGPLSQDTFRYSKVALESSPTHSNADHPQRRQPFGAVGERGLLVDLLGFCEGCCH